MAAFDTYSKRRGILGWRMGEILPVGHAGAFTDLDAQHYLGQPAQNIITNALPPSSGVGKTGIQIRIGIGF